MIIQWINANGPANVNALMREMKLNHTTVKPVLDELVQKGLLLKDKKPSARPGNPVYYHLTTDGLSIVIDEWDSMTLHQKLDATNEGNYHDLGLNREVFDFVTRHEKDLDGSRSDQLSQANQEGLEAVVMEPKLDPEEELIHLARPNHFDPEAVRFALAARQSSLPEKKAIWDTFVWTFGLASSPRLAHRWIASVDAQIDKIASARQVEAGFFGRVSQRLFS